MSRSNMNSVAVSDSRSSTGRPPVESPVPTENSLLNNQENDNSISSYPRQTTKNSARWTQQQKITFISLAISNLCGSLAFSVISPFFPQEATAKGASDTEIGFIFGVFELVIFCLAPVYGSCITRIGAKFMFVSGSFTCAGCLILFGFLDRSPNGATYVAMCFLCRIIEANGVAMVTTASFAIMAYQFPQEINVVMGTLESFNGLGLMIGPPLGGMLYAAGGYKLPFIVVGGILMIASAASFYLLPSFDQAKGTHGNFLRLFIIPTNLAIFWVIFASSVGLSFLDPTLAKHLIQVDPDLGQKPIIIGVIFLVGCGIYALLSPLLGWLCDKGYLRSQLIIGLFICFAAYFLMGPSPLLSTPGGMWLIIVSLVLLGIGVGMCLLPTFQEALTATVKCGYENNMQTFGVISGFYNCGFSLGAFVGPTAAGALADNLGFSWASTICSFMFVATGLGMVIFTFSSRLHAFIQQKRTSISLSSTGGINDCEEGRAPLIPHGSRVNVT